MIEKPVQRFFINAGIYLLAPELVKRVMPDTRIDMPSLLEQAMAAGNNVTMFPVHEYWLDIGRMDDYQRAQNEIAGLVQ
jgi:NDP-sugar pyrophosphorylase family protein